MTVAGPIVALVAAELRLYRSVFRWLARRRDVPAGAVAAPYYGEVAPILWAFVGVSAVELVAVHLILPWRTVQIIADVLGIWGLVWMLSFTASFRVFPHLVTAAGLRIRHGISTDIAVPWEDIATITVRARTREKSRAVQLDRTERDTALNIVIMRAGPMWTSRCADRSPFPSAGARCRSPSFGCSPMTRADWSAECASISRWRKARRRRAGPRAGQFRGRDVETGERAQ